MIITVVEPAVRIFRRLAMPLDPFPRRPAQVFSKGMDNVARAPSPLRLDVVRDGVIVTATINGELDLTTAVPLLACLLAVADVHPDRIVLDLSGLVFVDLAGARALDEAYRLLQIECPVIVRNPRPSARKIFKLTGLMAE